MWIVVLIILALALPIVLVGSQKTRSATRTAPYESVRKQGHFEVRDYPALLVVETEMTDSDNAFNRLFRFISGKNEAEQKSSCCWIQGRRAAGW